MTKMAAPFAAALRQTQHSRPDAEALVARPRSVRGRGLCRLRGQPTREREAAITAETLREIGGARAGGVNIGANEMTLRWTFEEAPELYDRVRPGYPEELFDGLAGLAGLREGSRVLELGCGTGQ